MPLFASEARISGNYRSYVPSVDPPEFAALARELQAMGGHERVAFARNGDAIGATARGGDGH